MLLSATNPTLEGSPPASGLLRSKLKAGAVHLGGSAVLLAIFLTLLAGYWYPSPYLQLEEGWRVTLILVGVDLAVGPLLTMIVYKPVKPGLRFDLTVIVTLQLAFFAWGTWVTYAERPAYVVFNVDRFTILSGSDVVHADKARAELQRDAGSGPMMVYAPPPRTRAEQSELVLGVIMGGEQSYAYRAERYEPYRDHVDAVLAAGTDVEAKFADRPEVKAKLADFLAARPGKLENYAFLPIEGRKHDMMVALDRTTGEVAGYIDVDPF